MRDIYELDQKHLLIVATDRISSFDVILPTGIPNKGKVLISNNYYNILGRICMDLLMVI